MNPKEPKAAKDNLIIAIIFAVTALTCVSAFGDITYNISVYDVPNSSSGGVIGIPRQQAVCLSSGGSLVVMWNGRYFYRTDNRGASWGPVWDNPIGQAGYLHQHLCVWSDTIWNFSPHAGNTNGYVQVIGTSPLQQINLTTVNAPPGYGEPIYSGQFNGLPNGMVMLARTGGTTGQYCVSSDRGRTWGGWQTMADYSGNMRIGLVSEGDSCMALIWNGYVDVWHYQTSTGSWLLENGGHFISNPTQRAYTGAVLNDTLWVAINDYEVSTSYSAKRHLGSGPITLDTLWHGNPAYRGSPEYIGYNALQVVEALDRVVVFYVHPSDGSSGPDSSKLYIRVWDGGVWSPEQLVSTGAGTVNLTSPFVVPFSHGNYAYCLFDDYSGGHLAAVEINPGVTRRDIDLAILGFKQGQVSMQEVLDLIQRYNSGQ